MLRKLVINQAKCCTALKNVHHTFHKKILSTRLCSIQNLVLLA